MSDASAVAPEAAAKDKDKQDSAAAKGGKKKLLIIIAAAVVALGAAGGGAWFFMNKGHADEEAVADSYGLHVAADIRSVVAHRRNEVATACHPGSHVEAALVRTDEVVGSAAPLPRLIGRGAHVAPPDRAASPTAPSTSSTRRARRSS